MIVQKISKKRKNAQYFRNTVQFYLLLLKNMIEIHRGEII